MYTLTAADFADTGQWRLIIEIKEDGLEATLQNTIHPELPPQPLCKSPWKAGEISLMRLLENAVYNNPRLLDDFATRIILFPSKIMFLPSEVTANTEETEAGIFCKIFDARESDVMSDKEGNLTAAWVMGEGVKGFIQRTFPGARVTAHLLEKIRNLKKRGISSILYAEVRRNMADIIFLYEGNLMAAASHKVNNREDLDSLIAKTLKSYGFSSDEIPQEKIGL